MAHRRRRTGDSCWLAAAALFCLLNGQVQGDCGIPTPINNANLREEYIGKTEFPIGSMVSYICDRSKGYGKKPGFANTITCGEDSTWSVVPEFCELTCDTPTRFDFGQLKDEFAEMNIFPVGTSVSYNCRPGYKPIRGKPTSITCLLNLTWSIIESFCERKSCGSPGEIINGAVELEDNLFGSEAIFSCNEGYRLVGRSKRLCLDTGSWSNIVPKCEAVFCVSPPAIEGGTHSGIGKEEFSYLSSVTYSCTSLLQLIGEASTHCTQYGNWSRMPPKCKAVICKDPIVENGQKISGFGHSYNYGHSVQFKCNSGFVLNGIDTITCGEDSNWSPPIPTCQVATTTAVPGVVTESSTPKQTTFGIKIQITTVETKSGEDEHEKDESNAALIGGILGGLSFLVVLGALYYVYKKKKEGVYNTNECNKDVPLNPTVTPTSQSAESDKMLP